MLNQLIRLKTSNDLLESDATPEKMREWYQFLIDNKMIILRFIRDELVGFTEFIYIDYIPTSLDDLDTKVLTIGPVLFVCNCVSPNKETMLSMKKELFKREFKYIVWHNKDKDKMVVFKGRQYESAS